MDIIPFEISTREAKGAGTILLRKLRHIIEVGSGTRWIGTHHNPAIFLMLNRRTAEKNHAGSALGGTKNDRKRIFRHIRRRVISIYNNTLELKMQLYS
jgi:hypothetical protein